MKKIVLVVVIALVTAGAAFAQSYTVQEVGGRVEREIGGGKWEAVKAGDSLRAETVIRTFMGASLKVKSGEQVLAVGAMKTGKLGELAGSAGVVQITGKVSQTDTGVASRSTGRVSTASARASEAAAGNEIEE